MTNYIEKKPKSKNYYQEGIPESVDVTNWRLRVTGMVNNPLSLSYDEIMQLPQVQQDRRMVCVCLWSIRRPWKGVLLSSVLELAGVREKGLYLKQTSIGTPEKGVYTSTIPLDPALERDALLCHSVDGAPLPLEQGYPLRLIDFGLYGYKSVKGLRILEVTDKFELGLWEARSNYGLDGTILPKVYWVVDLHANRFVDKPGEVTDF